MKVGVILLPLLLLGPAVNAGVYSYRDANGTLHAASSPEDIPLEFRGKEKHLSSTESGSGEVNLKLEREGNSLLLPVSFGPGLQALMILDTGASISMISSSIAEKVKPKQIGITEVSSASGVLQVPVVDMPEVSVGKFSVQNFRVTVNNLPGHGRAQGLLGVDFLNHFRMQLDTESGQLHLERK